jgi:hypothetical protein
MLDPVPPRVREYADQAVAYVQRALGIKLEYDSDTLPVLDHYLRTTPDDWRSQIAGDGDPDGFAGEAGARPRGQIAGGAGVLPRGIDRPAALQLVVATSAAYFGEVVRQRLGGRWEAGGNEAEWRVVLPTGIHFSPAGFVAAAIARADLDDLDSEIAAPPRMLPYVQQALARMGEVTADDYYSLCGRLDTLEHVHEVLVAVAAQMMGADPPDDDGDDGGGEGDLSRDVVSDTTLDPLADDPSGPVN